MLSAIKPYLIDAYRWATFPCRFGSFVRARRNGAMPVGILFYHRVADDDPNPWTIGCEAFRRQIDWFQQKFDIVSLAEAQQRIRSGCNSRPTISITFDDGYADNSAFALPLLIKRKIPVTYFVTTFHTTQGKSFQHDLDCGRPLATNSPDTLRAMADAGVVIGGHSRNHADLGQIRDPDELFDEVITSTREMEQVIGKRIRYFAFPYGQVENLNAEVFRLARENGLDGVCSAYGGWNHIGDDGFHLQRIHGDPELAYVRNWLTLDPRKRKVWQTRVVNELIRKSKKSPSSKDNVRVPLPFPQERFESTNG